MRLALIFLGVIVVSIAGFFLWQRDDEGPSPPPRAQADQVARGEQVARAGNCFTCHTPRGAEPFSGGVAIPTPFGTLFSSNITPHAATGIGTWSADDFWNALHKGISKSGAYLYPAFPFPNYTKVTREDADAMYAYFRTIKAVERANRSHELRFPYSRRSLMLVWRALYFRPGVYRDDAKESDEWNRGAYLVQGLGHCNACHASRNVLGAVTSEDFAGALLPAQDWYAPALNSDRETSLGRWSAEELATYLRTGVSERAATYGPMAAVIQHSLQHLPPADIAAMVTYLKSQVRSDGAPPPQTTTLRDADVETLMRHGAEVYERHCADCHQKNGQGVPKAYPALAGNTSILMDLPVNAIRMVYAGGFPPSTAGNPRPFGMPPFYQDLSDYDVAAVVTFIRRSWGNKARAVSQAEAARYRGIPAQ
jgi:mono/diheme cytochrome c family protein